MKAALIALALIIPVTLATDSGPKRHVTIKVPRFLGFPPQVANITVRVEPVEDQRELYVQVDGENYFRSATQPLDGLNGPKTNLFTFGPIRVPGDYQVTAAVTDNSEHILASATAQFSINGTDGQR